MAPSSNQNPVGNSKAAKFVASNPLAPLADPFAGMGDDEKELHKEVSDNVQKRLEKAMDELKEKHRTGTNEVDDVDRAPTGAAYRALHQHQRGQAKAAGRAREEAAARDRQQENQRVVQAKEQMRRMKFGDVEESDTKDTEQSDSDEDEFDHLLDEEDAGLMAIRQARIAQLKREQAQRAEHLSLGHGAVRTITQDEFLPECTQSSKYVVVHWFSDEFERCKIMDFHLKLIAPEHLEAKFLRIDAQKAPFFVCKLKIRTLPALIVFDDGKEIGRLTGFDGLALDPKKPDEWHTGRLREWIAGTGAIRYERPSEEMEEERRRMGIVTRGAVYSDRERSGAAVDEY
ncbi:hypothetical protein ACHAXT_005667 [Thalassiosira profunda]